MVAADIVEVGWNRGSRRRFAVANSAEACMIAGRAIERFREPRARNGIGPHGKYAVSTLRQALPKKGRGWPREFPYQSPRTETSPAPKYPPAIECPLPQPASETARIAATRFDLRALRVAAMEFFSPYSPRRRGDNSVLDAESWRASDAMPIQLTSSRPRPVLAP